MTGSDLELMVGRDHTPEHAPQIIDAVRDLAEPPRSRAVENARAFSALANR
jgi:hypothetical protein